jgi:hypothetical protein
MGYPFGNIEVRGARENNLKNVSLDIPRRQITVFHCDVWKGRFGVGGALPITEANPFRGRQCPGRVIVTAVRWHLRYPLSLSSVDSTGQAIGFPLTANRNAAAARRFFHS